MNTETRFAVLPGAQTGAVGLDESVVSVIPDMPIKLSAKEKKIWVYVAQALLEYGLIHRTDGLTLAIICRTFAEWVEATEELERYKRDNNNSYITESGNGYRAPHPLYYVARDHKKSLLTWLPEAALTIPSFQKAMAAAPVDNQPGLFDDPVETFKAQKAAIGMRLVGKT